MRICKPYHKILSFYCLTGEGNGECHPGPQPDLCSLSDLRENGLKWQPWIEHFVQLFSHPEPSKIKTLSVSLPWGRLVTSMTKIF